MMRTKQSSKSAVAILYIVAIMHVVAVLTAMAAMPINAINTEQAFSMSSTGTEFFVMTSHTPIIIPLYNNTNLEIFINDDNIPDYSIALKNTSTFWIETPWRTRAGSRIISDKPIIYKHLAYRRDHTGKLTVDKMYCTMPDVISYSDKYLAQSGTHTIISEHDAYIRVIGKNGNIKEYHLKGKIPLQISLSEISAIVSDSRFMSFNQFCKDSPFTGESYAEESTIEIIPISEFYGGTQEVLIDYNNDGNVDAMLNLTRTVRIRDSAPGARFISDRPIVVRQIMNSSGLITIGFTFDGSTVTSNEFISRNIDDEVRENSMKLVSVSGGPGNNVFIWNVTSGPGNRQIKSNPTVRIIRNRSVGYEFIAKNQPYQFILFDPGLAIPQISASRHIGKDGTESIRIHNPQSISDYENATITISCRNGITGNGCINNITLKKLDDGEMIRNIGMNGTGAPYQSDRFTLYSGDFVEATGKGIAGFIFNSSDVRK